MKIKADMHDGPVTCMRFNHFFNYAVSFAGGVPEVWDPETLELPEWLEMMSDTDLFTLVESPVIAVEFSPEYMALLSLDLKLRIFDGKTLKLIKVFNENIQNFILNQQGEVDMLKVPNSVTTPVVNCNLGNRRVHLKVGKFWIRKKILEKVG